MSITRVLCLLLSILILSGCGFHLRGVMPLAPSLKHMYLQTQDPYGELARNLEQSLKLSGTTLTSTPQEATVILEILNEHTGEQLLSVGDTQQTRQYNLTLTVTLQLTTPQGKVLVPPQAITETQAITIQSNQILAGSNEETNLYKQMRRSIISSIMHRLASKDIAALVTAK